MGDRTGLHPVVIIVADVLLGFGAPGDPGDDPGHPPDGLPRRLLATRPRQVHRRARLIRRRPTGTGTDSPFWGHLRRVNRTSNRPSAAQFPTRNQPPGSTLARSGAWYQCGTSRSLPGSGLGMARTARSLVVNCPYHVTHRGNHRERIFVDEGDHHAYLDGLLEYATRFEMEVWAYCLMPNHVHLLVVGRHRDSLPKAIGNAHRRHSRTVNVRYEWTGHLWANRYYSSALDETHLWTAVRYVELNPVRAGIVSDPVDYRWSSARAHALLERNRLLHRSRPFPGPIGNWRQWLKAGLPDTEANKLRQNTKKGHPTTSAGSAEPMELRGT